MRRIPNTVKHAGISEQEWIDKLRAGFEWCGSCQQWIMARNMSLSNPSKCTECYRKVNAERWRLRNARAKGLA